MPSSIEERVAYLEGKVEEQSKGFGEITGRIDGLSTRIDALGQKTIAFVMSFPYASRLWTKSSFG